MRRGLYLIAAFAVLPACLGGGQASNGGGGSAGDAVANSADTAQGGAELQSQADSQPADAATTAGDAATGDLPAADTAKVTDAPSGSCAEGKACDDGDKCTDNDTCKGGVCAGKPKDCASGLPQCKVGVCEKTIGACVISDKSGDCDDGDPCTPADFCIAGICSGLPKPNCCTPKCQGKLCGTDGCGGSCGSCKAGEICGDGACVAAKDPGETCADAMLIGSLPFVHTASTSGKKNDYAAPDKACYNGSLGNYGPDVTYTYTPVADGKLSIKLTGYGNKPAFYVVTDCADIKNSCLTGSLAYGQPEIENWAKVTKGKPIFIIVDADTDDGEFTLHVDVCPYQCAGKVCGYDGCGGDCGFCKPFTGEECSNLGQCVCLPNCTDKTCGTDGCAGSCGTCAGGQYCDGSGHCAKAGQTGDTCKTAIPINASPFSYSGSTSGYGNDLYAWAFCQGNGTGAYVGYEAPDAVFTVGGGKSEAWFLELKKPATLEFYAMSDCANPTTCKQVSYMPATLNKWLFVETPSNAPLFVVVDGYIAQAGSFAIQATKCATKADCPNATPGDYCSFAVAVDKLPFAHTGHGNLDSYFVPAGACGNAKPLGKDGQDKAFSFTAPSAGTYQIAVQSSNGADSIIYATKDCTKLATSCTAFADKAGENGKETLALKAAAGETWFVVVDNVGTITGQFTLTVTGP